ncbi:hypothetical protein QYE76_001507 [Lolium multiflorum]|uniref:Uncharacterized protein n=1 Tax=Lolium multiflorum TaxID=4521 RepID=A0AAD8RN19_LOLMU|nr:hypothetical protein QYE76_001507 [Lolium multiflorum]
MIHMAVTPKDRSHIRTYKTAKQAWERLEKLFLGNESIQSSRFEEVNNAANNFVMLEGETAEEVHRRLTALALQLTELGATFADDAWIKRKFFTALLPYEEMKSGARESRELIRLLWPTETLPTDLANLIKWLETAPDRFIDWKESAARAGADMALSFVLSWYDEVNLDQLECRRADVEENLPAENKTARLARACAIADFVDKRVFIEDPNPPSDDEEELEDEEIEMESPPPAVDPAGPPPAGA